MKSNNSKSAFALAILVATITTVVAAFFVLPEQQVNELRGHVSNLTSKAGEMFKAVAGSDCRIKGNISYSTGERIYHIPGQDDYLRTRIDRLNGERWFCTEEDARAAGWRKARN